MLFFLSHSHTQLVIIMIINSVVWIDLKKSAYCDESSRKSRNTLVYITKSCMHEISVKSTGIDQKNIQVKVVHRKYAARFELETCHMLDMALILNLLCCAMISNPMMIDDANDRDFFTSFSPHFPTNTQKKI